MESIRKYPRTPHLEGSRRSLGDEDLASVAFAEIEGKHVVVEEKLDGSNAGLSFHANGRLRLQSRGHFLEGGARERHFAPFKRWAHTHRDALFARLSDRFLAYGEWLYARHTIFYDRLPAYFVEFDVLDRETGRFLSTDRRRALLDGLPIVSAPVLHEGAVAHLDALTSRIERSRFQSEHWRSALEEACRRASFDLERTMRETDRSDRMEGLYVKVEDGEQVLARFKWVRASFHAAVAASGSHWMERPIVPNRLAPGVDPFAVTM